MPTAYTKLQQITNSFNGIYYSQPYGLHSLFKLLFSLFSEAAAAAIVG